MFHFGGMTLGYLAPAEKKTKDESGKSGFLHALFGKRTDERSDREREEEMARAFLTPWHLFY